MEQNINQKSRGVIIISLWMLLFPIPGLYHDIKQGIEVVINPLTTLEWGYYACGVVCAIGLLRFKPWARQWSVALFVFHFLWLLLAIKLLAGPTLANAIEMMSVVFQITPELMKSILVGLISVYLLWLFGVIFYLRHPNIRLQFS